MFDCRTRSRTRPAEPDMTDDGPGYDTGADVSSFCMTWLLLGWMLTLLYNRVMLLGQRHITNHGRMKNR